MDVSEDGFLLVNSYNKDQEEEADWLSGALLLPRPAALYVVSSHMPPEQAAEVYGISNQLLQWRLNSTGVKVQLKRRRAIG